MNIRKILFCKYFIVFFPVLLFNIVYYYNYFKISNIYSISLTDIDYHLDYSLRMKIVSILLYINYIVIPIYQLIINIIYNIKERNENYFQNIVLMAFSFILGMVIAYICSAIESINKIGLFYLDEDDKNMLFFNFIVLLIIIILGIIEKFILEKYFINKEKQNLA